MKAVAKETKARLRSSSSQNHKFNSEARKINSSDKEAVQKHPSKSKQLSPAIPKKQPKPSNSPDSTLFIESILPSKNLHETETCLEFLLVSFCKHFKLKPKQAAGLLTQGGKYLAHVLAKGVRGKHDLVVAWYQEIFSNARHLVQLIAKEEANGSLSLILSALKTGLVSRSVDTCNWCCRLFAKVGLELAENDMANAAWDWFVSDGGGIEYCLMACRKYGPDIKSQVASVIVQFSKAHFLELFSIHLRNLLPESIHYLTTMNELLPSLCAIRAAKQELLAAGIVDFWTEFGLRESESDGKNSPDVRLSALGFLTELWIKFPSRMEQQEEIANSILTCMKRAYRDKYNLLKIASLGKLFYLLDVFSIERNPYAPIIYKTLIFSLVENYTNTIIREYIMTNFIQTFASTPSIPIGILVDPIIKQMKVIETLGYCTFDFEFFIAAARHPRFSIKNAVQSLDILGKVYLQDPIFSKTAVIPFMMIAGKFYQAPLMQEYLEKFVAYGLKQIEFHEIQQAKIYKLKNKPRQVDDGIEFKRLRDSVLDIIVKIIKLWDDSLNEKIKQLLISTNSEIRSHSNQNYKGIIIVLYHLGDALQMVAQITQPSPKLKPLAKLEKLNKPDLRIDTRSDSKRDSNVEGKGSSVDMSLRDSPIRELSKASSSTSTKSQGVKALKAIPQGRALKDIEEAKRKRMHKEIEAKIREESKKKELAKKKRSLRQQLEKRKLELGVGSKQSLKPLVILEEGAAKITEEIKLKDYEDTPEDKESVQAVLRRYARVLKLLFKKYSSSGYTKNRVLKESFEALAEKRSLVFENEFIKLLKEQGVSNSMMTLEEFAALLRAYCVKNNSTKTAVDWQGFLDMIVQVAIFIYSKPPRDLTHLPPAVSVKTLFDLFRSSSAESGISLKFYDEPDPGVGDRDVVKKLNKLLEKDPLTQMPEGYKRVVDKELDIRYDIPKELAIQESQQIGIKIMDELLNRVFGIHIIEPQVSLKTVYRARGLLAKPKILPTASQEMLSSQSSLNSKVQPTKRVQIKASHMVTPYVNISPSLKYEVVRLGSSYPQEILIESAKVLDDLLYSVEIGSARIMSKTQRIPGQISNKVKEIQQLNEKQSRAEEERAEKRRKLRKQIIEERLKQQQQEREEKQKQEEELKKQLEELKIAELKKQMNKRKKEKEERERQIRDWHSKREEEERRKKDEEAKQFTLLQEQKKKQREEFFRREHQKLKEVLKERKEKIEEISKITEQVSKEENERKVKQKHAIERKLIKEKAKREQEKRIKEDQAKIMIDSAVVKILEEFDKSIDAVYNHYSKLSVGAVAEKVSSTDDILPYQGFNKFASQFNIWPGLTSSEEVTYTFRQLTKDKPPGNAITLSKQNFKEALVRLSQICKESLEKDLSTQLTSPSETLSSFFESISLPKDNKKAKDLLRLIASNDGIIHPREKKRLGTKMNRSLSKVLSPQLHSKGNSRRASSRPPEPLKK
jgi:hypothetical protein